jgi:hypothetical protein
MQSQDAAWKFCPIGRASEQSGQARLLFSYKTDLRYSDVDFREYKSLRG